MNNSGVTSKQAAIAQFEKQISHLFEVEYGDFKRKVGLYLDQLERSLILDGSADHMRRELDKIRQRVIFDPIGDIESSRQTLMTWVHTLH